MNKVAIILMGVFLVSCTSIGGVTRSLPQKVSDVTGERQLLSVLDGIQGLNDRNHRVAINIYRGGVLLTGEVPNQQTKLAISERASLLPNATKVYNYLRVHEPKSQSHTIHENYLKAKIAAKLLATRAIKSTQYELVVRDDTLYVMGAMTQPQAQVLQNIVAETSGVLALVSLFDIMVSANQEQTAVYPTHQNFSQPSQMQPYEINPVPPPVQAPNLTPQQPSSQPLQGPVIFNQPMI